MAMAPSPIILSILLLLLLSAAVDANVHTTCKAAAASGDYEIEYDFCATSLRTDPKSETANPHDLGLISAQLCVTDLTNINARLGDLIAHGNYSKDVKDIMQECSDMVCSPQIHLLTAAVASVKSGNYTNALDMIGRVRDGAYDCYDVFYAGVNDPTLNKEVINVRRLTTLSLFLIAPLKGK